MVIVRFSKARHCSSIWPKGDDSSVLATVAPSPVQTDGLLVRRPALRGRQKSRHGGDAGAAP